MQQSIIPESPARGSCYLITGGTILINPGSFLKLNVWEKSYPSKLEENMQ